MYGWRILPDHLVHTAGTSRSTVTVIRFNLSLNYKLIPSTTTHTSPEKYNFTSNCAGFTFSWLEKKPSLTYRWSKFCPVLWGLSKLLSVIKPGTGVAPVSHILKNATEKTRLCNRWHCARVAGGFIPANADNHWVKNMRQVKWIHRRTSAFQREM